MPGSSETGNKKVSPVGIACAIIVLAGFFLFLILLTYYPELSKTPVPAFGGLSIIYFAALIQFLITVAAVLIFSWHKGDKR